MQKFRISSGGVNVWSANELTRDPRIRFGARGVRLLPSSHARARTGLNG
jgi:hypothetical protein